MDESAVPMRGGWHPDRGRPSEDPFVRALQSRLTTVRAPESLRARIGAMLAAERTSAGAGEPGPDPSR